MADRYPNKRMMVRGRGGKFRKATMADAGIGGVCSKCNHLLLWTYDGDPRTQHPDPRNFRYRCFTCEPKTADELKRDAEIEAAHPKPPSIIDILRGVS